jgi:hypothetical protein
LLNNSLLHPRQGFRGIDAVDAVTTSFTAQCREEGNLVDSDLFQVRQGLVRQLQERVTSMTSDNSNGKSAAQPRRRQARPEVTSIVAERVEIHNLVYVVGTDPKLVENFGARLDFLEAGTPAVGGLMAQSARLARVEEALKVNGHNPGK